MTAPTKRLRVADAQTLERTGKRSAQIVSTRKASGARITITGVAMRSRAASPRHSREIGEQTWLLNGGKARLLTDGGARERLRMGDIIITPPGAIHGVENDSAGDFIYLTATTPPENIVNFFNGAATGRDGSHV